MVQDYETKPLSKLTNKEWRGFIITLTFLGVLIFSVGLKDVDWGTMKIGLVFVLLGVGGGFVLHYFFGIKIIQLRRDFKHKKFKISSPS